MAHRYCCQNSTQELLDHMVDLPADFAPSAEVLNGLSAEQFTASLRLLHSTIRSIYTDIIASPQEYGLPTVEDLPREKFDPKANASRNSARRLINLLYCMSRAGKLSGGTLEVDLTALAEFNKAQKPLWQFQNASPMLARLRGFGLEIEGLMGKTLPKSGALTLSCPDDPHLPAALQGYMGIGRPTLFTYALHSDIAAAPSTRGENAVIQKFAQYLQGTEREFALALDAGLRAAGLVCRDNLGQGYAIEYCIRHDETGYRVRCTSKHGELATIFRLRGIEGYADALSEMPERVRETFKRSTCRFCTEGCQHRLSWSLDGVEYHGCSYANFTPENPLPEDSENYVRLVCLERDGK